MDRITHSTLSTKEHKENFGQYLTPYPIASFMASLLPVRGFKNIKLLDPGAGVGSLTCAFIAYMKQTVKGNIPFSVDAYEIDKTIIEKLNNNIALSISGLNAKYKIINEDFIEESAFNIGWHTEYDYSHVIMNPPYKKLSSSSLHRKLLSKVGIETVNLYSAFLALSVLLLRDGGFVVAIIPRSFCNGTYFLPFRNFIFNNCSLQYIHLFESRTSAFSHDSVLQENIIILLQKGRVQKDVIVSYSRDERLEELKKDIVKFSDIVSINDTQKYIHIPSPALKNNKNNFHFHTALKDLNIEVSTGPIVDFRLKESLRSEINRTSVPLLYPVHFRSYTTRWPQITKKPNAIVPDTEWIRKNLFPKGNYVVVRRFSSKEEKHRIVASIIREDDFPHENIAIENHLNVFHFKKRGLDKTLAGGLLVFLNTDYVDKIFRAFSGHTQVNAHDLRNIQYPSSSQLIKMGKIIDRIKNWIEIDFDKILEDALSG